MHNTKEIGPEQPPQVGIKSASIYYHFATKAELGAAIVACYETRVLAAIGSSEDERELTVKLDGIRSAFRAGLARGDGMCLCGVLATEIHSLPPLVVARHAITLRLATSGYAKLSSMPALANLLARPFVLPHSCKER
ncbi:TetR/AcrR family transcriptional regulator [Rhizobium johnstonii]|uniref:TetR/AcrR family transcriptional regulator n=1 Tax=Rhizobium johnstonii TaxID=3019933 RepID=UPI000403BF79